MSDYLWCFGEMSDNEVMKGVLFLLSMCCSTGERDNWKWATRYVHNASVKVMNAMLEIVFLVCISMSFSCVKWAIRRHVLGRTTQVTNLVVCHIVNIAYWWRNDIVGTTARYCSRLLLLVHVMLASHNCVSYRKCVSVCLFVRKFSFSIVGRIRKKANVLSEMPLKQ